MFPARTRPHGSFCIYPVEFAVKAMLQKFYDRGLIDNYANADDILKENLTFKEKK